jgi:hypothetical protein
VNRYALQSGYFHIFTSVAIHPPPVSNSSARKLKTQEAQYEAKHFRVVRMVRGYQF